MTLSTYRDEHAKELREILKLSVIAAKAVGRLVVQEVLTPSPTYAPEPTAPKSASYDPTGYAPEHAAPVVGTGENAYPAPVQAGI